MKLVRRLIFFVSFIAAIICVVLLLNFTAPNPTGRRYSSASPVTTGQGSASAIGLSGEQILAQDLHTPRNDDPDQRQCICNDPNRTRVPSDCRVCIGYSQSIANYRRPDFVSEKFIAESKNSQNLLYTYTDTLNQIGDYVVAARAMNRPLWLYTRVDTHLDPEYYRMVESTGGGVVAYYTTPGYVDPIEKAAKGGLIASLVFMAITAIWEVGAQKFAGRASGEPRPPREPRSPRPPNDPTRHAKRKTDTAEDFVKTAKEHQQRKIDIEDCRSNDLD